MKGSAGVIDVKSPREIAKIREASRIAFVTLQELLKLIQTGLSTAVLNDEAGRLLSENYPGTRAAFSGYRGFPANLCVSVNAEVVHGVPKKNKIIQEGDLVSLDWGVEFQSYFGDCAWTVVVGNASQAKKHLSEVALRALELAVAVVKPGATVGDIGHAVQSYVEAQGMNVIRDFVGHGIGRSLHEEPSIPNWGHPGDGPKLVPGMTLAIEPMVTLGSGAVVIGADQWTAKTKENAPAAHFEHTVLVTDDGCEILTKP